MYTLQLNFNRILFVCALFASFLSVWHFPPMFPDKLVEVPLIAFFLGEVGIALFVTVLVYESANLAQILQLASSVLGFSLIVGAVGNFLGQTTQFLPDSYLLISWVQVVIMNLAGFLTTVSLYTLNNSNEERLTLSTPAPSNLASDKHDEFLSGPAAQLASSSTSDQEDTKLAANSANTPNSKETGLHPESLKEILEQLDVSRINKLERSLHPEEISLETLFSEESHAAQLAMTPRDLPSLTVSPVIKAITQTPDFTVEDLTKYEHQQEGDASNSLQPKAVADSIHMPADLTTNSLASTTEQVTAHNASIDNVIVANEEPLTSISCATAPDLQDEATALKDELTEHSPAIGALKKTMRGVKIPFKKGSPKAVDDTVPQDTEQIDSAGVLSAKDNKKHLLGDGEEKSMFQKLLEQDKFESFSATEDSTNVKESPSLTEADSKKSLETQSVFEQASVDKEVEDVFKRLVPKAAQKEVSAEELQKLREAQHEHYSLDEHVEINLELDKEDELIALPDLETDQPVDASDEDSEKIKRVLEAAAARRNSTPPSKTEESIEKDILEPPQKAKEIKEFGRLSSAAPASQTGSDVTGTMKSIGKMLIDTQAVENIIRAAESTTSGLTTARVVNIADGKALKALLEKIDNFEGSAGSILTGHDGLVIVASTAEDIDKESLGALSISMLGNNDLATQELELGKLRQMVLQSKEKMVVLIDLPIGVLSVFSNSVNMADVDELFERIGSYVLTELPELSQETIDRQLLRTKTNEQFSKSVTELMTGDTAETANVTTSEGRDNLTVDQKENLSDYAVEPKASIETKPTSESLDPDKINEHDDDAKEELETRAPVAASQVKDLIEELVRQESTNLVAEATNANEDLTIQEEPSTCKQSIVQAKEVKEFGRLSSKSSAPISVQPDVEGSMKAIGKLLIDTKAVENIIKAGESRSGGLTTARVISAARGEGIRVLLARIDNFPGVMGSLIVGHDGLVIASTLAKDIDKELLGALSSSIHNNTNVAIGKLELGQLSQVVLQSCDKVTILTNVDVGVLAVFSNQRDLNQIDGLLEAIDLTIHS